MDLLLGAMEKISHNCTGVIIDGFPQDKSQGILFEKLITNIDMILYLDCTGVNMLKIP